MIDPRSGESILPSRRDAAVAVAAAARGVLCSSSTSSNSTCARACGYLLLLLHAVPSLLDVLLVLLLVLRLQQLYGAVLSTALPASVHLLPACGNSLEGAASQKETSEEFWNIWIGNSTTMGKK